MADVMKEDEDHQRFLDMLVGMANAHTLIMNTMDDEEAGAHIKRVIDDHDVVFAIWHDDTHPTGIGIKLIVDKAGIAEMNRPDRQVPLNAIACADAAAAEQLVALVERHYSGSRGGH
jgi:hypothetical protein